MTMRISIDVSVFIGSNTAYGRIYGTLMVAAVPATGAYISFQFALVEGQTLPSHFPGQLLVASVGFLPSDGPEAQTMVMLEDIVCDTKAHAKAIADYMRKGFRLVVDEYGEPA